MTVASLLAYLAATALGLLDGYWAVMTCLVIMPTTLGGTLNAAVDRLLGTAAGALMGALGLWIQTHHAAPEGLVLFSMVLPLALLAAADPRFRVAPMTAALVLLVVAGHGDSFRMAFNRIADIAVGGIIATVTALFVLPDYGSQAARRHAAAALAALAILARQLMGRSREDGRDELLDRIAGEIAAAETACTEESRERALRFVAGPATEPLVRTIRRVRTDILVFDRVLMHHGGPDERSEELGAVIGQYLTGVAAALDEGRGPPPLAPLERAVAGIAADSSLGLACSVLNRDLEDLAARVLEYRRLRR